VNAPERFKDPKWTRPRSSSVDGRLQTSPKENRFKFGLEADSEGEAKSPDTSRIEPLSNELTEIGMKNMIPRWM